MKKEFFKDVETIKLNLGCGDKILEGYINIDIKNERSNKNPDIVADIRSLKLPSNYADEILAVHVVEHFYRYEVEEILINWIRILKSKGQMIIECPNLLSACIEIVQNPELRTRPDKEGQRSMWPLYGDPKWRDPLMVHRWGYTPNSLADLMINCGLIDVRQEPAQYKLKEPRDMRVVGIKV